MFTWICPKCGAEVPPSESDCPKCRGKSAPAPPARVEPVIAPTPSASARVQPVIPWAPSRVEPVIAPAPPAHVEPVITSAPPVQSVPASVPPVHAAPPSVDVGAAQLPVRKPASPLVVAIGSAVGIMAVLALLYLYVLPHSSAKSSSTALETPQPVGNSAPATVHPLAKYIEITGLRLIEDKGGQAKIGYIVVNHSPADLPDLRAHITLTAAGKPMFDFSAPIPSIGPYESKDLSTTVKTQLKPYELPDWQVLKPSFRITSN